MNLLPENHLTADRAATSEIIQKNTTALSENFRTVMRRNEKTVIVSNMPPESTHGTLERSEGKCDFVIHRAGDHPVPQHRRLLMRIGDATAERERRSNSSPASRRLTANGAHLQEYIRQTSVASHTEDPPIACKFPWHRTHLLPSPRKGQVLELEPKLFERFSAQGRHCASAGKILYRDPVNAQDFRSAFNCSNCKMNATILQPVRFGGPLCFLIHQ